MDEKKCKLGLHGNMTYRFPPVSSPLLFDEARHFVYVFCNKETSSRGQKNRHKRSYCSLCRHFHNEADTKKEGFEKYFAPETFKVQSRERSKQEEVKNTDEDYQRHELFDLKEQKSWENLTVEGLKMYKVTNKRSHLRKSAAKNENAEDVRNSQKTVSSARNGCVTCENGRDSLFQSQSSSQSKKRVIRIVLPQTDCKSRLSGRWIHMFFNDFQCVRLDVKNMERIWEGWAPSLCIFLVLAKLFGQKV